MLTSPAARIDPERAIAAAFGVVEENSASLDIAPRRPPPEQQQALLPQTPERDPHLGVTPSPRVIDPDETPPSGGGHYQLGEPYEVAGKRYVPQRDSDYDEVGPASWYGVAFHGRLTANGEVFDRAGLTAAHPTLPLPSYVRVTNEENGRSIVVRVNDRGPYSRNRLIDVSEQAAKLLGFHRHGHTKVRVEYVAEAPLDGGDRETLLASYRGGAPGVMLASAEPAPRARPARMERAQTVAFAPADTPQPAISPAVAMESLSEPISAEGRIWMAFEVATAVE